MDVAAFWKQEEAKTLEERRASRPARFPGVPVDSMVPWTIHAARLPPYQDIHTLVPPTIVREPTALFHLKSASGNNVFYMSRSVPFIIQSDAQNADALAKFQASLPKPEGSVRIHTIMRHQNPFRLSLKYFDWKREKAENEFEISMLRILTLFHL